MFKSCGFFIFFSLVSSFLLGQETNKILFEDSLLYYHELNFNSSYEGQLFKDVLEDKSKDYFTLNYLVKKGVDEKGVVSARAKFDRQIAQFKIKKVKSKDEKKCVKIIYKDVHSSFFKKYELQNHFDDVFTKGYYNCLSSTFLYSLILEELGIPYQINILPNHVNLTAYPESDKILIETTDPVKGYFSYDNKFKQRYIDNLLAYKLIEQSEIKNSSMDVIFNKYYSTNEVVSIKQLVGVQYSNDGLYLMKQDNFIEAIQQLEKSIVLYPSVTIGRILVSLYSNELDKSDYTNPEHLNYLIRITRYKELELDIHDNVIYELNKVAENHLINKKDTLFYKIFYNKLDANISDLKLKEDLKIIYYGSLGEFYMKEVKFDLAARNFLKSLKIKGDTINLLNFYMRSTILHVDGFSNKERALNYLNNAEEEYPDLGNDRLYMSYKAEVLSYLMVRSFERNKLKEGEGYRASLEIILDTVDVKKNENIIGIAYAQAGSYYFRKGNRTKARQMFKKGLDYSPGNYELESRLQMLNY